MLLLVCLAIISIPFFRKNAPHAGDAGFGMAAALAVLICGLMLSARLSHFSAGCVLPFVLCSLVLFEFISHDIKDKCRAIGSFLKKRWLPCCLSIAIFAFFYYLNAYRDLLPHGIDCVHHTVFTQKILLTNALAKDWLPFDTIPVNYPQGVHVILAMIATILRCSVPRAEQIFQIALVVPSALLVAGIATRFFQSTVAGWHAALAYTLLGGAGTFFDLWEWAGYPTMAGFLFLLALIWYAQLPTARLIDHCAAVFIWAAFALAHHMTLAIAIFLIPGWALLWVVTRSPSQKRFLLRYLLTGIAAVPIAFAIFPAYFMPKNTGDTFHLTSDPMTVWYTIVPRLGIPLFLAILGVHYAKRVQKDKNMMSGVMLLVLQFCSSFLCFIITEYIVRWVTIRFYGEEFTWFAPVHFLAACSLPLCILSGGGMLLLQKRFTNRRRALYFLTATVCVIGVVRFLIQFPPQPQYRDAIELASEIRKTTPENAFLLYDSKNLPEPIWVPVLAWRSCLVPPIPASEDRTNMRRIYWLFTEFDNSNNNQLEAIKKFLADRNVVPWYIYINEEGIASAWPLQF